MPNTMVQANKLWSQQNFGFKHIICLWQLSEKIIEIGEINDTKVKQLLKDINCNPPPPTPCMVWEQFNDYKIF